MCLSRIDGRCSGSQSSVSVISRLLYQLGHSGWMLMYSLHFPHHNRALHV